MTHIINHTFKEVIFVPYVAVTENLFLEVGNKAITSDGIPSTIKRFERIHVCSESAEWICREYYKMGVWDFIKRWNKNLEVSSMWFLFIGLKKDDRQDNSNGL